MFGRIIEFVLGGRRPTAEDVRERDARWVAHESQRYSDVRQAAWMAAFFALLFVGAGLWYILSDGDNVADYTVALAAVGLGFGINGFLSARAGKREEVHRAITLGSIFYQEPQVLRGLLRDEVIDSFLQNLLRTVMREDDLGDSLWRQTVSPLVDSFSTQRYRRMERYDVVLRRMAAPLVVPIIDGQEMHFGSDGFWRFESELSFERAYPEAPEHLWLGLVFDPDGGPAWFDRQGDAFALREYTALPPEYVDRLCSLLKAPAVLADRTSLRSRLHPKKASAVFAAAQQRKDRLQIAEKLCRPRLAVAGETLACDEVALDRRGLAARFPIERRLRRRVAEDWAVVRASLSFPLPMSICSFPAHFSEPIRGAEVTFDYGRADVVDVKSAPFFLVNQPFTLNRVHDREGRRSIATERDEWVLPGAGIAFSWRLKEIADRPPA